MIVSFSNQNCVLSNITTSTKIILMSFDACPQKQKSSHLSTKTIRHDFASFTTQIVKQKC